jgi:hypothetical protein
MKEYLNVEQEAMLVVEKQHQMILDVEKELVMIEKKIKQVQDELYQPEPLLSKEKVLNYKLGYWLGQYQAKEDMLFLLTRSLPEYLDLRENSDYQRSKQQVFYQIKEKE